MQEDLNYPFYITLYHSFVTVDWQNRDDVRAKLSLTVKKILMRYGYPPDLARLEADKVLAQNENLAAFFCWEVKNNRKNYILG